MKLIKKKAPKFLSASFVSFALMMATPMPAYGNLLANEQNLTPAQENSSMDFSNALEDMKEQLIIKETIQTTVDAIHNDYGQYITEQSEKALTTLVEESESTVDTETLQEICKHCQKILEQYKEIQKLEREAHLNEVGNSIQNAAYNTYYAKSDMCAAYVSYVFQNAGYGYLGGNANDMYYKYCNTSDRKCYAEGHDHRCRQS